MDQSHLLGNRSKQCRHCSCQKAQFKHGKAGSRFKAASPEYAEWRRVKYQAERHGKRVDPRWQDFVAFAADVGKVPVPGHHIRLIDQAGDYTADNCEWGPGRVVNKLYLVEGIEYTVPELAFAYDINTQTLRYRLRKMPAERAVKLRVAKRKPHRCNSARPA